MAQLPVMLASVALAKGDHELLDQFLVARVQELHVGPAGQEQDPCQPQAPPDELLGHDVTLQGGKAQASHLFRKGCLVIAELVALLEKIPHG